MRNSILAWVWNTLVFSISSFFWLWALVTLYNMTVPQNLLVVFFFAAVSFVFRCVFSICLRRKEWFPRSVKSSTYRNVSMVLMILVFMAVTMLYAKEASIVLVTDDMWDAVWQSLPLGIGQLFTSMAYEAAGNTTASLRVLESLHNVAIAYIMCALVTVVASAIRTIPLSFKVGGNCYEHRKAYPY